MSSRKEQKEQARLDREAKEQQLAAQTARRRRVTIIGGVLGIALIAVVAAVVVSSGVFKSKDIKGGTEVSARLDGIPQKGIELGKPDAPATIVEFADLKCPFCREFAVNGLPDLIETYIKTGKAKIIFRNLTILDGSAPGQDSTDAATMAGAVGLQNKMWNFIDLWYVNQKDENTVYATDSYVKEIASQIPGVDVNKAFDARESAPVKAQLDAAQAAADARGITGTPTFLVGPTNGKLVQVEMNNDLGDISPLTAAVDAASP
ncbi:MAG: DsbA family protein [Solirubrobacterales bacterium]